MDTVRWLTGIEIISGARRQRVFGGSQVASLRRCPTGSIMPPWRATPSGERTVRKALSVQQSKGCTPTRHFGQKPGTHGRQRKQHRQQRKLSRQPLSRGCRSNSGPSMIRCIYCNEPAQLVTGKAIYPKLPTLADKQFWRCRPCLAHVGCHPGTTKPLGTLAKARLRGLRIDAHTAFDPLWHDLMRSQHLSKSKARGRAYSWLSAQLDGQQSNISHADEDTCLEIIRLCKAARTSGAFLDPNLEALDA